MISTQYINLNMIPSGVLPILHCSQYDVGRPLGVVVYNSSETVDLSEYTVTVEATRTDGTAITAAVSTEDNIGTFTTTATMTNVAESYTAQLVIVDSDENRVASIPFTMRVVASAMNENSIEVAEDASLYYQYTASVQASLTAARIYLTPEMYGAAGDGETDDTTALQSAINAAGAADLPLVLNGTYLVTDTLYTNASVSIISGGTLPYYPGIISDQDVILYVNAAGLTMKDIYLSTADHDNSHTTGIYVQCSVDDAMMKLINVHLRYLLCAVQTYGNSMEFYDCHFSMCITGISLLNGTDVFDSWEYKSILIKHNRFHDTVHCITSDADMGTPESYNNGITITENFADKSGAFYEGTPYNVIIGWNHFVCTRSDENGDTIAALIALDGSETSSTALINTCLIEGNIFGSSQSVTDIIAATGCARYVIVRNNVVNGSGTNLITVTDCPYVTIERNTTPNKNIVVSNTSTTLVAIRDNLVFSSATITADCAITAERNVGYTFDGTPTVASSLTTIYQGTMSNGVAYDCAVAFDAPVLRPIYVRVYYSSAYYFVRLPVSNQTSNEVYGYDIGFVSGVTLSATVTFGTNTVAVTSTVTTDSSSGSADIRGVYMG